MLKLTIINLISINSRSIDDIDSFSRNNDIKGFEIVKKVWLSKENFTVENNLLTTTMKLKRHIAKNYFKEQINKLYGK